MEDLQSARLLAGARDAFETSRRRWLAQEIDQDLRAESEYDYPPFRTTLAKPVSVTGPGTFLGKARRTVTFEPSPLPGWWLDRDDLSESLPIPVSVHNVWNAHRNIVLHCGSPHNYLRMVEHIVALKVGLGLDDIVIRTDSGDPPLFERGSLDLVEAVEKAGIVQSRPKAATCVTVTEPVAIADERGAFLAFLPARDGDRRLHVDCAVDFRSAIGRQRIRFDLDRQNFRHGAFARTNCPWSAVLFSKTVGLLFADIRNLGYNPHNILVTGRRRYYNEPRLAHKGKALEAVWHRACLDLLAAIALINRARFAGTVISYKSGHVLDCRMIALLYRHRLLSKLREAEV
jgi:UDP-3-O-acyl-N-acetylglucosamine deacetylase